MKLITLLLGCLVTTTSFAADRSRWVEMPTTTAYHVYMDLSQKIVDDDFIGYRILLVYPHPAKAKSSTGEEINITGEIVVIEYSCKQSKGRGVVVTLLDEMQHNFSSQAPVWANIVNPPATEIQDAVKERACGYI